MLSTWGAGAQAEREPGQGGLHRLKNAIFVKRNEQGKLGWEEWWGGVGKQSDNGKLDEAAASTSFSAVATAA